MSKSVVEQASPRVSVKGRGTPTERGLPLGVIAVQVSGLYEDGRGISTDAEDQI